MGRATNPVTVDRLHAWVDRCQQYAAAPVAAVAEACEILARMAATVPAELSPDECAIARRLLDQAWQRVLSMAVAAPALAEAEARRPEAMECDPHGRQDRRIVQALHEIDRRYADPRLRLKGLAHQLAVSPTHLTQLLKLSTGATFGAHVHQRRVAQAQALLVASPLSIKEIAARVGYASTTQLDRHFKKITRRLPSEERQLALEQRMGLLKRFPREHRRQSPPHNR